MITALANPDWIAARFGKGDPLNVSFSVPGEFAPRSLSDFRGRVVVVSLWRTADCPQCLMQMSALHDLSLRYGREGLMAVLLSDQDAVTLARFGPLRGMAVMTGHIEKDQADLLPPERPFTFVIDRDGIVRKKLPGGHAADQFESLIEHLLGR